jgi:hypothetical protein
MRPVAVSMRSSTRLVCKTVVAPSAVMVQAVIGSQRFGAAARLVRSKKAASFAYITRITSSAHTSSCKIASPTGIGGTTPVIAMPPMPAVPSAPPEEFEPPVAGEFPLPAPPPAVPEAPAVPPSPI